MTRLVDRGAGSPANLSGSAAPIISITDAIVCREGHASGSHAPVLGFLAAFALSKW